MPGHAAVDILKATCGFQLWVIYGGAYKHHLANTIEPPHVELL